MGPDNRPLDLDWLEDFLALADSGSFSRAAQARAIAQPAFSRHIRALEEWVGVPLFDRTAHPASLTAAGQRFQPLLEAVLADLQAARIKARAAHDQAGASLRIAVTNVLSLTYFPGWLAGLEQRLSLGRVLTLSDSLRAGEDLMLQRRVQFVLCHGHADVPGRLDEAGYPMQPLGLDRLVPISAPSATDPQQPRYALGGRAMVPLLAYGEESGLGRILNACLRDRLPEGGTTGATGLDIVFTGQYAMLLRTMALDGRGVAWVPESLVACDLAAGRLVAAAGDDWQVPIEIRLYRQHAELIEVAESLWRLGGQPHG